MWPLGGYIGGAALLLGILGGWTVRDWKAEAEIAGLNQKLVDAKDAAQTRYDGLSAKYEAERANVEPLKETTRTTIKEIYRNVPPVPAVCAPPDSAGKLLDAAIATANTAAATGEFGPRLPNPTSKAKPVR